jgi:50S ribosomal protein L16 3-hydroxylase
LSSGKNEGMNFDLPWPQLGGLTPTQFMRRHWQRKPALFRAAALASQGSLKRQDLFALARDDSVESRLVVNRSGQWSLDAGPFKRLPPVAQGQWTLLLQGMEAHSSAARGLMDAYRFLPDARLDDVMVSWAADGGGVGPHFDAYDVFLVQISGRRRWRIGRQKDLSLRDDLPLKILRDFQPEQDMLLEPGDVLYLPPRWAHEGVAVGDDCITASVGFRAPSRFELAEALLPRLLDNDEDDASPSLRLRFSDAGALPTLKPGAIPAAMTAFAQDALQRVLDEPQLLARCLGEWLSEPKARQDFLPGAEETDTPISAQGVRLAPASRMLYDDWHVFINGESFRASGRDASLMRQLADARSLGASQCARLSPAAQALVSEWISEGWLWTST